MLKFPEKSDAFMIFVTSLFLLWLGDILYTCNDDHLVMGRVWDQLEIPLMVSMCDMLNILYL